MPDSIYAKTILLVEDQEKFYTPVMRWLQEEGYQVTLSKSYSAARCFLNEGHFHLAIVDIRLVEKDEQDRQGLQLAADIQNMDLKGIMPCILLTAHATKENVIAAWLEHGVARLIEKKPGYRKKLLDVVQALFEDEIKINFDLNYDAGTDQLVVDIARDINWSLSKPQFDLLTEQVRDLFGKLFAEAKSVFISKLKPGLTGAAVVRVHPTWEHGLGPAYVAKVGRRDKVEKESKRYKEYVEKLLPNDKVTQVDIAYTRHLGMLLYRFAEGDTGPLSEFDQFYQHSQPEAIIASLHNLFQNTCRYWYDHTERKMENLPQLYYRAFELDESKLVNRIQSLLPGFMPDAETFRFNPNSPELTNPLAWLAKYQQDCVLPVYQCITHGDLTGRNIMVSNRGRCWLIDFYRTYPSHILRDFVILESDIKYRLLPMTAWPDFLAFEKRLVQSVQTTIPLDFLETLPVELQKAGQVIMALRDIAYKFSRGRVPNHRHTLKEYLISLLMTTLNVARLRHIPADRKLQAMLSAVLICNQLDTLAGRIPDWSSADEILF
ncbi:MAG: response regulator [Anaerolineaceae bacterium]|nr:response regulator [Anaerolineaceae bacterium]